MSGIYIKDMEMPTSCMACQWSRTDITNTDWCVLTEKDLPCDCPLIEVPDHGDLIDRDMVLKKAWDVETFVDAVKYAPTVIPADVHDNDVGDIAEGDCRDCNKWETCECGKQGHDKGTSIGYSIGECKEYVPADKDGAK